MAPTTSRCSPPPPPPPPTPRRTRRRPCGRASALRLRALRRRNGAPSCGARARGNPKKKQKNKTKQTKTQKRPQNDTARPPLLPYFAPFLPRVFVLFASSATKAHTRTLSCFAVPVTPPLHSSTLPAESDVFLRAISAGFVRARRRGDARAARAAARRGAHAAAAHRQARLADARPSRSKQTNMISDIWEKWGRHIWGKRGCWGCFIEAMFRVFVSCEESVYLGRDVHREGGGSLVWAPQHKTKKGLQSRRQWWRMDIMRISSTRRVIVCKSPSSVHCKHQIEIVIL